MRLADVRDRGVRGDRGAIDGGARRGRRGGTSCPRWRDLDERGIEAYANNLRGDPVLQKLLAWELAGPSDTLRRIDAARSKAMYAVMPKLRGDEKPPEGVDAPAVNAILLAALHYLTLRGATMGGFSGLPLKSEADWKRVMATFQELLARTYAQD